MNRKKIAVRVVVVTAVVGASVVAAVALLSPKRTSDDQASATTTSTVPVLVDPNTSDIPLDPGTAAPPPTTLHRAGAQARSPSATTGIHPAAVAPTTTPAATLRGQPSVTWALSGSCTHAGTNYSCQVVVKASNGLLSGGFVEAYPESGYANSCVDVVPLARGAASISGQCAYPFAPNVLVVYVVAPGPHAPVVAYSHFAWS